MPHRNSERFNSTRNFGLAAIISISNAFAGAHAEEAAPGDIMKALDYYADGIWKAENDTQTPDGQSFPVAFDLDWFDQGQTIAHMTLSRFSEDAAPVPAMIEGYYYWHPVDQSAAYFSFSFDGRLNEGDMDIKDNGDMVINFLSSAPNGRRVNLRIERMVIDADNFNEVVSILLDEENTNVLAEGKWRRLPE